MTLKKKFENADKARSVMHSMNRSGFPSTARGRFVTSRIDDAKAPTWAMTTFYGWEEVPQWNRV